MLTYEYTYALPSGAGDIFTPAVCFSRLRYPIYMAKIVFMALVGSDVVMMDYPFAWLCRAQILFEGIYYTEA